MGVEWRGMRTGARGHPEKPHPLDNRPWASGSAGSEMRPMAIADLDGAVPRAAGLTAPKSGFLIPFLSGCYRERCWRRHLPSGSTASRLARLSGPQSDLSALEVALSSL